MEKLFGKSWKTTVVGIVFGTLMIALPIIQSQPLTPSNIVSALGIALLGFLTKQYNVTGGTIQQDGGTVPKNKVLQNKAEQ